MKIIALGLCVAKNVSRSWIDSERPAMLCRKVRPDQLLKLFSGLEPCLVGMEAYATAHHWARPQRMRCG
jgi:transposase